MDLGWHPGAQICAWHDGRTVVNAGVGTAAEGVPMQADSVNLWLSASKPIGAVAAVMLREDGLLDLDAPVTRYWPEFGANGKERITTRHLLLHTAGTRTVEPVIDAPSEADALTALAGASIERGWEPGKRAGYHPFSGWQILGEVIRRVSGMPFDEFVAARIFKPLQMSSATFSFTPEDAARLGKRFAAMHRAKDGQITIHPDCTPGVTSRFVRPANGLRAMASDIVRFYRMLLGLGELDGVKLLDPRVAAEITSPQRTGMKDETFGQVMDWGLGVMLDNKVHSASAPYGYGRHSSGRTFGHGGRESSITFADPGFNLAVAIVFNAMAGEPTHDRRTREAASAIYEDLGLA
jgi:CubicO group peptidase (beta-lactamase class C family)